MRKIVLAAFLLYPFVAFTATHPEVGTTGFNNLKIEGGARPTAMGCAFVAVANDLNALWWNPAGLGFMSERGIMTSYRKYWANGQSGVVAYGQPIRNWGMGGVAITYEYSGLMDKTNDDGEKIGDFSTTSALLTTSFAHRFSNTEAYFPFISLKQQTTVGVSAKFVYMNIDDYYGLALAADAGINHKIDYNKGVMLGMVVQNLGVQVKPFIDQTDPLPLVFRFGISYPPKYLPLTLSLDAVKPIDNYWYVALGGEFRLLENVFIRGGYSFNRKSDWVINSDKDSFMGMAMGVGITWRKYMIDYSYTPSGQLGSINRFSFMGTF
jgi:hypothetical protein